MLSASSLGSLVIELDHDAYRRNGEGPAQHRSGNAAVVDRWAVRRIREIFGIAAKVISDPGQLRVFENCRPRHHGEVSPICVLFTLVDTLHFRFSLSAVTCEGNLCRRV